MCKVWELRVNNLWPVMRMYPNLKTLMLEHVRNQVRQGGGRKGGGSWEGGGGCGPQICLWEVMTHEAIVTTPPCTLGSVQLASPLIFAFPPARSPQTLVTLAVGNARQTTDSHVGAEHLHNGMAKPPADLRGWCESAASISRALLHQPQDTIEVCMEELRKVGRVGGGFFRGERRARLGGGAWKVVDGRDARTEPLLQYSRWLPFKLTLSLTWRWPRSLKSASPTTSPPSLGVGQDRGWEPPPAA